MWKRNTWRQKKRLSIRAFPIPTWRSCGPAARAVNLFVSAMARQRPSFVTERRTWTNGLRETRWGPTGANDAHELAQRTAERWIQSRQTCGESRGNAAGIIEARTGNLGHRSLLDHKAIRKGVERTSRTPFPGYIQFVIIFLEFFCTIYWHSHEIIYITSTTCQLNRAFRFWTPDCPWFSCQGWCQSGVLFFVPAPLESCAAMQVQTAGAFGARRGQVLRQVAQRHGHVAYKLRPWRDVERTTAATPMFSDLDK